jgi:hypothetical protein
MHAVDGVAQGTPEGVVQGTPRYTFKAYPSQYIRKYSYISLSSLLFFSSLISLRGSR